MKHLFPYLLNIAIGVFCFTPSIAECEYGPLYEEPSVTSKVVGKLPCKLDEAYSYDKFFDGGTGDGTVLVLKDTRLGKIELKKGETLQYDDPEEGGCMVTARKVDRDLVNCVWTAGFTDQQKDTYRVTLPAGHRRWYHVVDKSKRSLGWYILGESVMDPTFTSLSR
jgi:hypothetical protein